MLIKQMYKADQMFEAEILITFPTRKRSHQVVPNCVTVLVFSNKTTLLFMTSPFQKHWLAPTLSPGHQGLDYLSRLHESFRPAGSVFQKTDGDLTTLAFAEPVCCKEQIIWRVIWSHDWRRGVSCYFIMQIIACDTLTKNIYAWSSALISESKKISEVKIGQLNLTTHHEIGANLISNWEQNMLSTINKLEG